MPSTIKLTVIGGARNGSVFSFSCVGSVLVGRSRSASLHLPEPDVSGRHFEFVADDGGCEARVLSKGGLVVDGRKVETGQTCPVKKGSLISVGSSVKIRIDEIGELEARKSLFRASEDAAIMECAPSMSGSTAAPPPVPFEKQQSGRHGEDSRSVGGFDADADTEDAATPKAEGGADTGRAESSPSGAAASAQESDGFVGDETYDGDQSLTIAEGDGETQEMKTRIGSIEEIRERKRGLERMQARKHIRFGLAIALLLATLAGVWWFLGFAGHGIDVDGPYLENGEFDERTTELLGADGNPELFFIYPRNDAMTVSVSPDSNKVEGATWFGTRSDVPFHLDFTRRTDKTDLQNSLEESFENWMETESKEGFSFKAMGGYPPRAEFFEDAFRGMLEVQTLCGVRFIRTEFTRPRAGELWHGSCVYFRRGDEINILVLEIPDMFWKIAGRRVAKELHMGIYATFSDSQWDSPGRSGLVDTKMTDDEMIMRVRHDLSGNSVAMWPSISACIDTLLVRSWGDKPRIQKEALAFRDSLLEQMVLFYREREHAFATARANRDERRMKAILKDCKSAFAPLPRDRRHTLVNNPEVWSCRPRR